MGLSVAVHMFLEVVFLSLQRGCSSWRSRSILEGSNLS